MNTMSKDSDNNLVSTYNHFNEQRHDEPKKKYQAYFVLHQHVNETSLHGTPVPYILILRIKSQAHRYTYCMINSYIV